MNIQFESGQNTLAIASSLAPPSSGPAVSDAFRNELASVLESTLEKYGIQVSGVTISVDPASSTGQPSQNLVTPSTPSTPPVLTAPTAPPAATSAPPTSTPAVTQPPLSYDDNYWANQPPAVQQLRHMTDINQKGALAEQLSAEGYTIDVPIMVWGWDPQTTMGLRHSFGYTWVPAMGQAPVTAAPGITSPVTTPYDPSHPPAGSIQVA